MAEDVMYVDEQGNEVNVGGDSTQSMPMQMVGQPQSAEFLKYLLDTQDPIVDLQNELEGKEIVIENDRPVIKQVRAPLVNPVLRNKIISVIKTYNNKGFITTTLGDKDIYETVREVSEAVIDQLERSKRYSSINWQTCDEFRDSYPAFMEGTNQQILLMIEHTIFGALKRSKDGLTLDKVTGMHTSQELKSDAQRQKRSMLGGIFSRT